MMHRAGAPLENELAWRISGALAFPVIAFLLLAVITGPLFVLVDLRQAVRNIEAKTRGELTGPLRFDERKEPTF